MKSTMVVSAFSENLAGMGSSNPESTTMLLIRVQDLSSLYGIGLFLVVGGDECNNFSVVGGIFFLGLFFLFGVSHGLLNI